MTPTRSAADRATLGFEARVDGILGPLLRRHGFRKVSGGPYDVVYRSDHADLTILHDKQSYELSLSLLPTSTSLDGTFWPVGMQQLIAADEPARARAYRDFATTTPEGIDEGLKMMTRDLEAHAVGVLAGADPDLLAVQDAKRAAIATFTAGASVRAASAQAKAAFERGDWLRVVETLAPLSSRLTVGDLKRLEIARSRA